MMSFVAAIANGATDLGKVFAFGSEYLNIEQYSDLTGSANGKNGGEHQHALLRKRDR